MITVATIGSRRVFSNLTKKESTRSLFCQYKIRCTDCQRGYVLASSSAINLCFKNTINKKEELLIGKLQTGYRRNFSREKKTEKLDFNKVSTETLESLSEYFDEVIEEAKHLRDADVSAGDGVLTIKFGKEYGTYVINRQVPNQQIWLSSPKSGPKRYDFIDGTWIYKHDGKSLGELLNEEIPDAVKFRVSFNKCSYCDKKK